jgi:anti-sigma B factor antagonist
MQVEMDREQEVLVLRPTGRLDATHGPTLEQAVQSVLDEGTSRFVIDMAGVPYISSAGLGVLLKSAKGARAQGGRIVLSGLADSVNNVFEISGFLTLFVVHATCAEAVESLGGDSEGTSC